ncbi:MAG: replicative DNA helicase [Verrucomicrobiales bacterium]|jgi:replicative DNA helicase|nr:replicative DNA helicase [Verrucomicrobiales bacterium]
MIAANPADYGLAKPRKPFEISFNIESLPAIHSPEAERAVLGAMLSEPEQVIDLAEESLTAEDFFQPAHQTLFRALSDMRARGVAIDPSTLLLYLEDRKLGDAVGGVQLLGELSAAIVSVLTAPSHIQAVRQKSILRHLQEACAKIVYDSQERQHELEQVLDEAEKMVFEITDRGVANSMVSSKEVVYKTIEIIERTMKMKGRYDGLATGFNELDKLTTGFKPGEMIVIAARPGVGKTALALSMAKNFIKERYDEKQERFVKPGYPVAFFSLEMTAEQLMLRLLASLADVRLQSIRDGKLNQYELDKLMLIAEDTAEMPLFIDESSLLSINQLRAKARRMKKLHDIQIIIIDYLQLLTSSSEKAKDNRQVEVAEISRGIKALAKELKVPIIVLAQLNRKPEEGNQEPALHHLRESGSIEQDADVVLLLSRTFEKEEGDSSRGIKATLNIAKQRNGTTDKLHLRFIGEYTRYEDEPRETA